MVFPLLHLVVLSPLRGWQRCHTLGLSAILAVSC